jgi:hypothetical protein
MAPVPPPARSAKLDLEERIDTTPLMTANVPARQVLARYSAPKVAGWSLLAVVVSISVLCDGWMRGWHFTVGRYGIVFLLACGGAPFVLAIVLALLVRFALSGGAAIARVGSELVLYFPLGRKRIPLTGRLAVSAISQQVDVPTYAYGWGTPRPNIFAEQVTFSRAGQPDLNFRTGLLTEDAATIAERIRAALLRPIA